MATALKLSSEQLNRYREAAKRRSAKAELSPADKATQKRLLQKARQAATLLKKEYQAKRVFLFGSLAHQAWFTPETDIDLAVEGLEGDFWRAWRQIEKLFEDRPVDLVELESVPPPLRHAIERDGIAL